MTHKNYIPVKTHWFDMFTRHFQESYWTPESKVAIDRIKIDNSTACYQLDFNFESNSRQQTYQGDVRKLDNIADSSVDLICTHPPYLNLVTYLSLENPTPTRIYLEFAGVSFQKILKA